VLLPPTTENVPGGTAQPPNIILRRAFNTGDVVHFGFASAARDAGVTRTDWDFTVDEGTAPSSTHVINRQCLWTETNVAFSYTLPRPMALLVRLQGGGAPVDSSHGTAFGVQIDYDPVPVTYCAYGSQLQPAAQFVYYLTPGLIDVWLAAVEMPFLAPLFTAWWFTSFNAQELCAAGPPPLPAIDLSTLDASAQTVLRILQAIAWPSLCQCTPGTPNPTPYPPPTGTQPPGWPSVPIFPCDNVDPCAALISMQKQLSALQQALNSNLELTTLLQRYGLPFAYVPGATHSGLHVSGSFAISRLAGVRIHVVSYPGSPQTFTGVPPYVPDLGWVSILTGDGLIDEIRLTRIDQTWFPKLMPLALQLGVGLREGVVVDVQELQAET
jgi:hypothetical protein